MLQQDLCVYQLQWVWAKLAAFLMEYHFYLKTNHAYSDVGIWQTFFSKMNKVRLSLQGKQLKVFIANNKIPTL